MKYFLTFALICSSLNLFADEPQSLAGYPGGGMYGLGMGPGYGVKYDPCIVNLNMALLGYGHVMGQSPISIDDNGKLVVNHKKVKSFNENGKIKTIVYTSVNPYGGEEVLHKIDVIEEEGKIVHVTRYEDLAAAKKWRGEMKIMGSEGLPMVKKTDLSFEHHKSGCQMTASEMTMEKDGKEEIKVTHDKKLCDNIAPLMNQMGRQNAMQCAGLFSQIEDSYKARNKEFAKDGKELLMGGLYGMETEKNFGSKSRDWTVMSIISNCMITNNPINPGMGFGIGMGYPGVGIGGGIGIGGSAPIVAPAGTVSK